ncbi:sigma-54-dependent transcriptional regulator [Alkalilimnicola ehrlichii MLHE-1]|uniref:Two component, sigma54 specific, transcriptional regulator, Fis family n=1 Tax=Alkalilimnicola ehrlichii (strain ATCC BAA-1101 / DSM 17681 / MLHE-1) TaxID=187272 RepID=Q0A7Z5_ALKEH|nr:sigma-54 dependent transcriptional regulator [Alkalilimnicola ehrlichii]ABI57042.1 two component, sigma54 specific, transcriptional regulator, Fis family [Alkalilimnicola ehrlichii MLHE-1]
MSEQGTNLGIADYQERPDLSGPRRIPASASVLVIDDEPGVRNFLERALVRHFRHVRVAANVKEAEAAREEGHYDLIISDIRLPGVSGVDWVEAVRAQGDPTDVIFITAYADLETAIAALRAGASDFILKPFRMDQLYTAIDRCFERRSMQRENFLLHRQLAATRPEMGLVGESQVMQQVCKLLRRLAVAPSTVLIRGESGTGKELAARALHRWSDREGPFVPVNCGAIAPELMESELFGHGKGAFTGAQEAREGLFSHARGGTLFLDEISEMPLAMQAKLLRVLEDHRVRPVGSDREVPVDVRVVAASNRELAEDVQEGRFRKDLYYRLDVVSVELPPLRERPEDIQPLAEHLVQTLATELGVPPIALGRDDLRALHRYPWPGNVRELRNVIERALLLGCPAADCISGAAIPVPDSAERGPELPDAPAGNAWTPLDEVERVHILRVLDACDGNKSEAARRLGVARKTLDRKLARWQEEGRL